MSEAKRRYPLMWPDGWKRTASYARQNPRFKKVESRWVDEGEGRGYHKQDAKTLNVQDAVSRLREELRRLGVTESEDWLISSNGKPTLEGLPGSRENPSDPGVAVYFRLKKHDRVLACDRWNTIAGNIAAIAAHIEAIRAVDRYGVGSLEQAFAGYTALPARGESQGGSWRNVLQIVSDTTITRELIEGRYRELAKRYHPDLPGGSHEKMALLGQAKADAIRFIETTR